MSRSKEHEIGYFLWNYYFHIIILKNIKKPKKLLVQTLGGFVSHVITHFAFLVSGKIAVFDTSELI